jgi:hypothetical protein
MICFKFKRSAKSLGAIEVGVPARFGRRAWPPSTAATIGPRLGAFGSTRNNCSSFELLEHFAFRRICVFVCPVPFPSLAAQGGRGRFRSFLHVFLQRAGLFREDPFAVVQLVAGLILNGLSAFLLIRLGLLALVSCFFFQFCFLEKFPLTTQGSAWYAGISLARILLMGAMAFYGFYTSLGGRPVFGGAVLEE